MRTGRRLKCKFFRDAKPPFLSCLILSLPSFSAFEIYCSVSLFPYYSYFATSVLPDACKIFGWNASPQLAAAECGCHNRENVLIISAIYARLRSPKPYGICRSLGKRTKAAGLGSVLIFAGVCSGRAAAAAKRPDTQSPCASGRRKQRCLYLGIFLFPHSGTFCVGFPSSHKSRPQLPSNTGNQAVAEWAFVSPSRGGGERAAGLCKGHLFIKDGT